MLGLRHLADLVSQCKRLIKRIPALGDVEMPGRVDDPFTMHLPESAHHALDDDQHRHSETNAQN